MNNLHCVGWCMFTGFSHQRISFLSLFSASLASLFCGSRTRACLKSVEKEHDVRVNNKKTTQEWYKPCVSINLLRRHKTFFAILLWQDRYPFLIRLVSIQEYFHFELFTSPSIHPHPSQHHLTYSHFSQKLFLIVCHFVPYNSWPYIRLLNSSLITKFTSSQKLSVTMTHGT